MVPHLEGGGPVPPPPSGSAAYATSVQCTTFSTTVPNIQIQAATRVMLNMI
jgi:hypothetical protein